MTMYAKLNNPKEMGGVIIGFEEYNGVTPPKDLIDITGVSPIPTVGWGYSKGDFVPPEETPSKLTRIKFKQRMTAAERIAIRNYASSTEPYAPEVFDFMDLLSEATYIDLSLPETIEGVNLLETLGLLSVGRADEILNTPVTEEEAY